MRERWDRHVILRPSIIYGPPPAAAVPRPLFLQWLDGALRAAADAKAAAAAPAADAKAPADVTAPGAAGGTPTAGAGRVVPVELFEDEWRNPILVHDIGAVCLRLLELSAPLLESPASPPAAPNPASAAESSRGSRGLGPGDAAPGSALGRTFNMGGPERLSRADMGVALARARGLEPEAVLRRVPSASVKRPVASPADISMDSGALERAVGFKMTGWEDGIRRALQIDS